MEELLLLVEKYSVTIIVALVFSLGVTLSLLFSSRAWRPRRSAGGTIPGKLGLPFLGETISFLSATNSTKGCYHFVRLRRQWHGKWFKTRIFGKVHVFVPSTEGARMILANDFEVFNKGYVKSMADGIGEKSLLCIPRDGHKRIRRLLSEPFSINSLSNFVHKFDKMVCQRLKKLEQEGKSFRVHDFSLKITFDAMCEMLLSVTEDSLLHKIDKLCTTISDGLLSLPLMIPGTRYYKGVKARRRLMEIFREMMERRRSGKERLEDFLQSMSELGDSDDAAAAIPNNNEKLDDSELLDNLLTLIIAGQTTTSAAIMWSVKFLDDNREAQSRLREEQLSIAQSKPQGSHLTLDDIAKMSYGSKVMKETLRMANVVMWYPRVALQDCNIQGFEVRKGWHVNVDASHIHYDPDLYPEPTHFIPERFDETPKPYSFIPFGSGPRTCLGMNMAKVTMLVFLHRLTSGYKWTVDDLDNSLEKKAHIPKLRNGCRITLMALRSEEDDK